MRARAKSKWKEKRTEKLESSSLSSEPLEEKEIIATVPVSNTVIATEEREWTNQKEIKKRKEIKNKRNQILNIWFQLHWQLKRERVRIRRKKKKIKRNPKNPNNNLKNNSSLPSLGVPLMRSL